MPELADVEGFKRYVSRHASGRRVRGVHVRDPRVLRNTSAQGLGRALHGSRLRRPTRHGKWLVIPAGKGKLVVHFGMTGELVFSTRTKGHEYDQVVFELGDGELRYRSKRKLGGVWWVNAGRDVADVTGALGPDAASVERESFRRLLAQRKGGIKAALMNQKLLAGLGNELSDEILWRARVRPTARVEQLTERELDELHRAMQQVLRLSMKHGFIPKRGRWLNAARGQKRSACPRCGTTVKTAKVAGRTSYFCPHCQ